MLRQARLDAPGSLHHVIVRGIERAGRKREEKVSGLLSCFYATEQSGTSNVIWTEIYFHGLGRTTAEKQGGPGARTIIVDTEYNTKV